MSILTVPRLAPANVAPAPTETPWTLDVLGDPAISFVVPGNPAPQGSKAYKGTRNMRKKDGTVVQIANLQEQSKRVKPWRALVEKIARQAVAARPGWEPLADALVCDMVFTLPRPQRFPKNRPDKDRRFLHGQATSHADGDDSKLLRSTEDALTTAGVWVDDSLVVGYRRTDKVYVGTVDPDALRAPGAVIRVWTVPRSIIDARTGRL